MTVYMILGDVNDILINQKMNKNASTIKKIPRLYILLDTKICETIILAFFCFVLYKKI